MIAQKKKSKNTNDQAIANAIQRKQDIAQRFRLEDNRLESIAQRKLLNRESGLFDNRASLDSLNSPMQLTIISPQNPDYWAKSIKKITGKKLDRTKEFLGKIHKISDMDFSIHEIAGFYDTELADLTHTEMGEDYDKKLLKLKRFAARQRDDEEGHGAERHGEPGDQYLVDRVNKRGGKGAFTASSLNIDDFLQWDTVLNREADGIYEKYEELAGNRLAEIRAIAVSYDEDFDDPRDIRTKLNGELDRPEYFNYKTESDIVPKIFLTTEVRMGGIREEEEKGKKKFKIPIGAEALGSVELTGRAVSRLKGVGGLAPEKISLDDVIDVKKRPESYTGGLSPFYTIRANGSVTGKPSKTSLDWVTKF